MRNPILQDIPEQFETDRLIIRCPRPGDGPMHHAGVVESLDALRQFPASLTWAMNVPSVEASEHYCRESAANYRLRTDLPMLLFSKESNEFIGSSGLHAINWSVPKCEIGFWVNTKHARRGFMTEAVRGITRFAFDALGMRRIEALPDNENIPSCLVCERAGYELEGVLRNERSDPNGRLRNTRLYAITQ